MHPAQLVFYTDDHVHNRLPGPLVIRGVLLYHSKNIPNETTRYLLC
jgi:hypothetical protein